MKERVIYRERSELYTANSSMQHKNTINIVTCILIVKQKLGKRIPAGANARNNRTSIARQRISKHSCLTIDAVFSA
jgi:hypothetical protein